MVDVSPAVSDMNLAKGFLELLARAKKLSIRVRLVASTDEARRALAGYAETVGLPTCESVDEAISALGITFDTKITRNAFRNAKINFLGKRKIFYVVSGLIILGGVTSLATKFAKVASEVTEMVKAIGPNQLFVKHEAKVA